MSNFPSFDARPGQLGDIGAPKYGRGTLTLKYLWDDEEEEPEYTISDEESALMTSIQSKIDGQYSNLSSPTPRGSSKSYSDMSMSEFAGHHRNPSRQGISPYKQGKHSGPALGSGGSDQAFKTTGNYRRTGTQYGSSRPHKILTKIEDDPIWDIRKIKDPMERSFLRKNNRVKKVLSILKEYLNDEII